jgi:hypothetical protein
MYSQTLLTTSPRASGCDPTMTASSSDGCRGFCRAFGALPVLGGDTFFPFTGLRQSFLKRVSCSYRSLFLPRRRIPCPLLRWLTAEIPDVCLSVATKALTAGLTGTAE